MYGAEKHEAKMIVLMITVFLLSQILVNRGDTINERKAADAVAIGSAACCVASVSYTNLTLPTILRVFLTVFIASLNNTQKKVYR